VHPYRTFSVCAGVKCNTQKSDVDIKKNGTGGLQAAICFLFLCCWCLSFPSDLDVTQRMGLLFVPVKGGRGVQRQHRTRVTLWLICAVDGQNDYQFSHKDFEIMRVDCINTYIKCMYTEQKLTHNVVHFTIAFNNRTFMKSLIILVRYCCK